MMEEDYSKSKKKPHKSENQKFMMKISSTKNVSGIGCVILLGGALITAAAMGSAFLISRKNKKSTNKITKNEKTEDESSNKGLHFLLPEQQQTSSSNGTDKLCHNDSTTSSISTPCLIQELDDKRDTLNAIVSDHPKEEGKSPSLERSPEEFELSETKISLLPDPDQKLDEVSRVIIEKIQGNEKIEILSHVHQAQDAMFINPALQMDDKREFLVHNDKGESNELQHTGVIEMDNLEEGLIQEQEKQATGDQETSTSNEHEPLNSAFELMKAADEDEDKDHLQCMCFEEQCADAETQIDQFAKKCDVPMQFSDEEEGVKQNDQAISCYEEATSENSPCRIYSIDVQNLDASAIRNASIDDEHSTEAYEDEDKSHMQIMYFEEQCADEETKIDQIAKKCDERMQFSDEEEGVKQNDQTNSCYEEATSENSPCRTYSVDMQNLDASAIRNASIDDEHSAEAYEDEDKSHMQIMYFEEQCADAETEIVQIAKKCDERMQFSDEQVFSNENDQANSCYDEATSESSHRGTLDAQTLAASEIRNALVDDQHSAEVIQVIKETYVMDPAATGEQSLDTEQLVEKQSFESDCQGNVLNENEVEASVFVNEEAGEEYDDYDDSTEKEDAAHEVKDDILEGARNSSEQSNSDKIWPADSNQELLLEHKQENVKEAEDGTKTEEDELSSVKNCNLKSTQNDIAITSCQQSYDGKDGSTVNVIDSYRTKLMYLDDIAAITRRRRVLLGALLVLIWYFVLKGILPV